MSAESSNYFDNVFAAQRIMVILRGYSPEETVERVEQAWDFGLEVIEVPIQSPAAMPSLIAALDAAASHGRQLGAGTITSIEQLEAVVEAGVAFTVAPGFDPDISQRAAELGIPHLPGVASATEIQLALRHGHHWVKAFPAAVLGVDWFRAMRGPFPDLNFVATGGITTVDTELFLHAGIDVVSLGSSLTDPEEWQRLASLLGRL